jgi:coniferyl-aldehyde dehydrogenase
MTESAALRRPHTNGVPTPSSDLPSPPLGAQGGDDLAAVLRRQREAFLREGSAPARVRVERIDRLVAAVLGSTDAFIEAMRLDFGHRPPFVSLADMYGGMQEVKHTRAHVAKWMRPRRASAGPLWLAGVRARVEPAPLGVVGVVASWNYPLTLSLSPAASALAAGNRLMVKMSELAPRTAELLRSVVAESFAPEELHVVTGGPEVGAAFGSLPFDHLFFTGSTSTGRHVLRAAAENLVPVTLELGGKNPSVVGRDADLERAAARIVTGRMTNGGQLCLSPDYVFVPRDRVERFVDAVTARLRTIYPTVAENEEYVTVVSDAHYARITGLVEDARARGARVVEVCPPEEKLSCPATRRIPPTVVLDVTDGMRLMQEEVFGPVLAVLPYERMDEVIDYVNAHPTPLAAYYFGGDTADFRAFTSRTRSGGLTRNDCILHCALTGVPFGGVGSSGMGYYHGRAGFDTFTHLRATATSPARFSPLSFATPPFPAGVARTMRRMLNTQHRKARKGVVRSKP